jgi:hypothetical protein
MLPVLVLGYIALNFFFPYHTPSPHSGFGFYGKLLAEDSLLSQIFAPFLILLNAILINAIFNRNGFMEKNNYLPALIYVVGKSYFHSFYFFNSFGVAETFLVLAFLQIFKLDQNLDGRKSVFNAAFFVGVAASIYPMLFLFVPGLFFVIWVLRPFVFRESVLTAVGFLIPIIYAGSYSTLFGIPIRGETFMGGIGEWKLPDLYVVGGGLLILLVTGAGIIRKKLSQCSIRLKKLFRVLLWMVFFFLLLGAVELLLLNRIDSVSIVIGWIAFLITYSFSVKNLPQFPVLIFYLVLIFSVGKFFLSFEF